MQAASFRSVLAHSDVILKFFDCSLKMMRCDANRERGKQSKQEGEN